MAQRTPIPMDLLRDLPLLEQPTDPEMLRRLTQAKHQSQRRKPRQVPLFENNNNLHPTSTNTINDPLNAPRTTKSITGMTPMPPTSSTQSHSQHGANSASNYSYTSNDGKLPSDGGAGNGSQGTSTKSVKFDSTPTEVFGSNSRPTSPSLALLRRGSKGTSSMADDVMALMATPTTKVHFIRIIIYRIRYNVVIRSTYVMMWWCGVPWMCIMYRTHKRHDNPWTEKKLWSWSMRCLNFFTN